MRKIACKDVGEFIDINIEYDEEKRTTPMHKKFELALNKHKNAKDCFINLPPSKQKEILRYLNNLKTEESLEKNIKRAINFLEGKESFIGRSKP